MYTRIRITTKTKSLLLPMPADICFCVRQLSRLQNDRQASEVLQYQSRTVTLASTQ